MKRILVSGAAGSLGRQICKYLTGRPGCQILGLDHSEHGLYQLQNYFSQRRQRSPIAIELMQAGSAACLGMLRRFAPDQIIHAAAYKHVPVLEQNPYAALQNNFFQTYRFWQYAARLDIPRFLLVSTDKAACPGNALGVSKRLAELVLLLAAQKRSPPSTAIIRLCNVASSRGSVLPLWRRQIAARKPLTITHPDMERYFISPSQAAAAIIRGARSAGHGEILMPHYGPSIRLQDLALQTIRAAGLRPEVDIPLQVVGLRPGERLREPWLGPGETLCPPRKHGLPRVTYASLREWTPWISRAMHIVRAGDEDAARSLVADFCAAQARMNVSYHPPVSACIG